MTPFEAALSSSREAAWASSCAFATSPDSTASRALRIAVFREDLTALLRSRAFSLVLIRLIWDLMFATNEPLQVQARSQEDSEQKSKEDPGSGPGDFLELCLALRGHETQPPRLPAAR